MNAHGYGEARPIPDTSVEEEPVIDLTAGYVLRALPNLPKQGTREPWKLRQNYFMDVRTIRRGAIEDGAMQFSAAAAPELVDRDLPVRDGESGYAGRAA
jgi:hypothetical protein